MIKYLKRAVRSYIRQYPDTPKEWRIFFMIYFTLMAMAFLILLLTYNPE